MAATESVLEKEHSLGEDFGFLEARLVIEAVNRATEAEEARELDELDDSIAGTSREELRALRASLGWPE